MDGPEYTAGNYLAVSWAGATRPEYRVSLDQDTRLILQTHFAEDAHRRKTVRNALAIASLLNRTLVRPRPHLNPVGPFSPPCWYWPLLVRKEREENGGEFSLNHDHPHHHQLPPRWCRH
jgi:hypothetical protein